MYSLRLFEVLSLYGLRKLYHICNRIVPQQVLVVKMVKQNVQSLLGVIDLGFEGSRCS